jgi:5-methylcytosine-specific restriction endonuclease McrA
MWIFNEGKFDESGYQIDHILEVTNSGSNDSSNLQVLCPSCHSVKTKRCSKQKWKYTSEELDYGYCSMEIEKVIKKNKKE